MGLLGAANQDFAVVLAGRGRSGLAFFHSVLEALDYLSPTTNVASPDTLLG